MPKLLFSLLFISGNLLLVVSALFWVHTYDIQKMLRKKKQPLNVLLLFYDYFVSLGITGIGAVWRETGRGADGRVKVNSQNCPSVLLTTP